jgi:sigma-54 dependent transcriptional regulator, acetoin dehydrogenase operon transcriptional activator AcoR
MLPAAMQPSAPGDDRGLARARERFLTAESVEPYHVRDTILASWWRSRRSRVAADRIDLSYIGDPDLDTPLTRSAMPVLRGLRDALDGQPISVILTDANGLVLSRLAADSELDRHLDGVRLAPGFSYAEEFVGTNGIGTALEGGRPMHVFGHEHYAEHLEDLACAGVPIRHPISGRTVGAVDLTCWRKDADPLLIALAKTTADQIMHALLADSNTQEVQLLQEFLRTCKRTSGMVLALSRDTVMLNDYARQLLDPADQAVLLGQAAVALDSGQQGPVQIALPTGVNARLYCRPITGSGSPQAGVVHVRLTEDFRGRTRPEPVAHPRMHLPGLVGSGTLWVRGCTQVEAAYASSEWLALSAESGVGKLAVLRAVHQRHDPAGRFHVLDAAQGNEQDWLASVRGELAAESGSLVLRHVDQLSARRLHGLAGALQEAVAAGRHRSLWVAVTLAQETPGPELARLLRLFPCTVELPPLRHHADDLHELVPFLLGKLNPPGRLVCSADTMQLLLRYNWPGNSEQLWQVLRRVVQHRRTGVIKPKDLPPECRTVSRRLLSPLESMERDAIVQSLLDFNGNKVKAAESLGMSRATIYRKIHEYGIVVPAS